MKKPFKVLLIILAVFVLAVVLIKGLSNEDDWICDNGSWVKHGQPSKPMPETQCPTASQEAVEKNIIVTIPKNNVVVSNSFLLSGKARVFENQFSYRLKDGNGKVITSGQITSEGTEVGQYGNFSKTINFTKPNTNTGLLEVFDNSAKDGSEIDLVTIPLSFK